LTDRKFVFTASKIGELDLPKSGRNFYIDQKISCLWLQVTMSGAKTFMFKKKIGGKVVVHTLGAFKANAKQAEQFEKNPLCVLGSKPPLTVDQARELAIAILAISNTGVDLKEQRELLDREKTLADLFECYVAEHGSRKKTADVMRKDFARNASTLSTRRASAINHTMALTLHHELTVQRGSYTANRTIQLLRAVFNYAKKTKRFFGDNPFAGVTLNPETARNRFLSREEVSRLIQVLEKEPIGPSDYIKDFVLLSLFTGVRRTNLCSMAWTDVNLQNGLWVIPDTKNGTPQTVALGGNELAILARRKESLGEGQKWVFPGEGVTGHLMEPKRVWNRIRRQAGIPDCTIHDLRRSLGSAMAASNVNVAIIKNALHHKDMKTTVNVYAHAQKDAVLQARELVQFDWLKAAGLIQESEVLDIGSLKTGRKANSL
jgi:integrase